MVTGLLLLIATSATAQDGKLKVVKDTTQSMTKVAQELEEVAVVTRIQKTRMNGDVMVTRVVGSPLSNAGSAEDALARVPGLMRRNGQIEVIGKGAPLYYINGRKVQDPTELQQLSSQEIKSVEVINTPGAQYDAQVNAVVRIYTVKRSGDGIGGNFEADDNYSPSHGDNRFGTTMNLNYRHNGLELFGGGTFYDSHLKGYTTDFTQRTIGASEYYQDGDTKLAQHYKGIRYNFGADWQLAEKHSLGFKVERTDNLHGRTSYWMNDKILIDGIEDDVLKSDALTKADGTDSWSANTYYLGQFGKLGIDWNIDYYKTSDENNCLTHETDKASKKDVYSTSRSGNELYATKLVFSYPLGRGKLQAGTEIDRMNRSSRYTITENSIANDQSEVDENTYALFAEYGTMTPFGMINAGLRYEHVDFDYKSLTDATQNISRQSDHLFPTFSFATQVKEVQASLSYSVKTRRPSFSTLRSNIEYNNRYTLSTGNPKLKNEINHQVALNARWRYLGFTANYLRQQNGIYDWTYPYDDNGTVMIHWVNFDKPIHQASAYVNLTNTFGHWTPSYTAGFQKQWLSFDLPDPRTASGIRTVEYNKPMYIVMMNNSWKVPSRNSDGWGAWQFDLNSEFLSRFHYGNAESRNCFWDLSFSVQKSWLENDALSLRLTMSDIAHTAYHDIRIDLGNYVMTQSPINGQSRNVYDTQCLTLALRYKFNATKNKYRGTGAGADVRSRM